MKQDLTQRGEGMPQSVAAEANLAHILSFTVQIILLALNHTPPERGAAL